MSQRYQSAVLTDIGGAGKTVVHNLTGGTPTEYGAQEHGPSAIYFLGVSATNVVVASVASAGTATGRIFASIPHTVIQ